MFKYRMWSLFALFSILAQGAFASKYHHMEREGVAISLMSSICPADETHELKLAIMKIGSNTTLGCYSINNRGNVIVVWSDGGVNELLGSWFHVRDDSFLDGSSEVAPIELSSNQKLGCVDYAETVMLRGQIESEDSLESPSYKSYEMPRVGVFTYWLLRLDSPQCMISISAEDGSEFLIKDVLEVQISLSPEKSKSISLVPGQKVLVTGRIFDSNPRYHDTKFIIEADSVTMLGRAEGR